MNNKHIYGTKKTRALAPQYKRAVNAFLSDNFIIAQDQDQSRDEYVWLVNIGDKVKEGSVIASSPTAKSQLYSPVPGVVNSFISCTAPDGHLTKAAVIKTMGSFSYLGKKPKELDTDNATPLQVQGALLKSGILNTFPHVHTHLLIKDIKALEASGEKSLSVCVAMIDRDPTCVTDTLISRLFADELKKGAFLIAKALATNSVIFCKTQKELDAQFARQNVLKIDASTAFDAWRTVRFNMPLIDKYIHVSGDTITQSALMKIKIGSTIGDIAKQCEAFTDKIDAVIVNGFLMGFSTPTLTSPVTKSTKSIYFVKRGALHSQVNSECILCGKCDAACPKGLSVTTIYNALQMGQFYSRASIDSEGLLGERLCNPLLDKSASIEYDTYMSALRLCDNCGRCSMVCPTRIPLSQIIYNGENE